jgi:hypothetical protein
MFNHEQRAVWTNITESPLLLAGYATNPDGTRTKIRALLGHEERPQLTEAHRKSGYFSLPTTCNVTQISDRDTNDLVDTVFGQSGLNNTSPEILLELDPDILKGALWWGHHSLDIKSMCIFLDQITLGPSEH